MEKGKLNKVSGVFVGILFLFAIFTPHCISAQKTDTLEVIKKNNEPVYGKRFYAVCQTVLAELAGSKPEYMKPCITVSVSYNPSPGTSAVSHIVGIYKGDKEMPITGKADFEVLAIDKNARGYNEHFGRNIGVLGETGKYFAVQAKVRYDGSKENADRMQVKYKVKLIDKEKYEKKYGW